MFWLKFSFYYMFVNANSHVLDNSKKNKKITMKSFRNTIGES